MKHLLKYTAILFLLYLSLFGCNKTKKPSQQKKYTFYPQQIILPEFPVEVPIELTRALPLLDVYINEQGPFKVVLDTGTTSVMLSKKIAYSLNLPTIGTNINLNAGGRKINLGPARRIKSLKIGDAEFANLNIAVHDIDNLNLSIDGVIGMQVFKDCILKIDYPSKKIVITDTEQAGHPEKHEASSLPLIISNTGVPYIQIKINDKDYLCMIDSGHSSAFTLAQKEAENIPLLSPLTRIPTSSATFVGKVPNYEARIDGTVSIGQNEFTNPIIRFQDEINLIGGEILRNFVVTIDQGNMIVKFSRDNNEPILHSPSYRHHGFFFDRNNENWKVTGAIAGVSLDQIGLMSGDKIETLNGIKVADITDGQLKAIITENDILKLKIERNESEMLIDVPVTVLIP